MNRRALLAYLKSLLARHDGSILLPRSDVENIVRVLGDGGKGSFAARLTKLEDEIARLKAKAKAGHPGLDEWLAEVQDYLQQHEDIKDGEDGQPQPNTAMSLLTEMKRLGLAKGDT